MILGLGGLHGARGLTDRLWTPPGPKQFVTPVVLQPTVRPELWGTWQYNNSANAIVRIVEQMTLDIRIDATGSVRYGRLETEYQTGCESGVSAEWPQGNWSTNGQQLIFNGPGTEDDRFTCNPAQNTTHPLNSHLIFSSYQVSGNTMFLDPYPAIPLTDISSTTNPTAPLHHAFFQKTAFPPSASWGNWVSLGGVCVDGCAVASWAPDRLDVFAVGADRALYHRWRDGSTWSSNWQKFDAYCVGKPAAVSWGPNRIDVFITGGDSQIYQLFWDGQSWKGWVPMGGQVIYGCAATSSAPNTILLYATGPDQAIYGRYFNGSQWSAWQRINSNSISAPAASAAPDGVDVACIGPDHNLYFNEDDGAGFTGWQNLGPYCMDSVGAASWGVGSLDFFITGADRAVYQRTYNAGWQNWNKLGGQVNTGPDAVAPAPNRIEMAVIGADNAVYSRSYA
jgi:hypothetical protein